MLIKNVKKSNILGTRGLRVKWQNTWRDKPQEKQQIVSTTNKIVWDDVRPPISQINKFCETQEHWPAMFSPSNELQWITGEGDLYNILFTE